MRGSIVFAFAPSLLLQRFAALSSIIEAMPVHLDGCMAVMIVDPWDRENRTRELKAINICGGILSRSKQSEWLGYVLFAVHQMPKESPVDEVLSLSTNKTTQMHLADERLL